MSKEAVITEDGAVLLSEKLWTEAQRRAEVIGPLAKNKNVPLADAVTAAEKLGISARTIYYLLNRWKKSGESVSSLVLRKSRQDKGKSRLKETRDSIIANAINDTYLSHKKRSVSALMEDIKARCDKENLRPPSINTVKARIKKITA